MPSLPALEQQAYSYVVAVEDNDGVRLLLAGAEWHGRYMNPGPRQNQGAWARELAESYDLSTGAHLHIITPTNNPEASHCGHMVYMVRRDFHVVNERRMSIT